jgi:two-component system chemotaxis response regulator CheY
MANESSGADIFIVDDNNLIRAGMVFMLERENFVVKEFHHPDPLMAELFSTSTLPRLVISDYEMRGMNGMEIIKALKNSPTHEHIPVLIISAQNSSQLQREAEEAGAVGWVKKTSMVNDLVPAVQKIIR